MPSLFIACIADTAYHSLEFRNLSLVLNSQTIVNGQLATQ